MFWSFYITDSKVNLIFEYLTSSQAPTFKQLYSKLAKHQDSLDSLISISKDTLLCKYFSFSKNLYYWTLCKNCDNPLEPITFLVKYDAIVTSYFDKDNMTMSKLVNDYNCLALLLHSMLDGGEVVNTDTNRLKDLVPVRQNLSTVLNSTTKSIASSIKNVEPNQLFGTSKRSIVNEKAVPWRSTNIHHSNNEIYLDFSEMLNVVLQRTSSGSLNVKFGTISGKIDIKCYLNGNPTVHLNLNTAGHSDLTSAYHRCIDSSSPNFEQSKLCFIPPDGKFTLAEYRIDLDELSHNSKRLANIGLVKLSLLTHLGTKGDEFEIRCNIENCTHVSHIENLRILAHFPHFPPDAKIRILRNTHGGWECDLSNTYGTWIFDNSTPVGSIPILRGCVEYETPIFPSYLTLSYSNCGQLPSGIRVNSISIPSGLSQGVQPFKGVKYTTLIDNYVLRA